MAFFEPKHRRDGFYSRSLLLFMLILPLVIKAKYQVNILYITTDVRECLLASQSTYSGGNADVVGSTLSTLTDKTIHDYRPYAQAWMGNPTLKNVEVYVITRDSNYNPRAGNTQTSIQMVLNEMNVLSDKSTTQTWNSDPKCPALTCRIHAIAGPIFSSETRAISQFTNIFNVATISGSATSPTLTSRQTYPLFFRTIPSDAAGPPLIMHTLLNMGYTEVNGVYFQDDSNQAFQTLFDTTVAGDSRFQQGPEYILYTDDIHPNHLQYFTNAAQGVRSGTLTGSPNTNSLGQTFVWMACVASNSLQMYQLLCAFAKAGVSGAANQGFLFGPSPNLNSAWWAPPSDASQDTLYNNACTLDQIQAMLLGTIQVVQANYDVNNAVSDPVGISGSTFYEGMDREFQRNGRGANKLYGNFAYQFDSITAAALALDYAYGQPDAPPTFQYTDTAAAKMKDYIKSYMNTLTFQGLTGKIQFDPATGDRLVQYFETRQFQASTWSTLNTVRIGTVTVNNGTYSFTGDQPAVYPTSDGKPPPQFIPPSYAVAIALGIIGGLIFLLGIPLAVWLIRWKMNKIALEAALKNAKNWLIEPEELKLESSGAGLGGSMMGASMTSMHSAGSMKNAKSMISQAASMEKMKGPRPYATYTMNQQRVCAFPLRRKSNVLDREIVEFMMNVQGCASDNVARFVGVSLLESKLTDGPAMHSLMGGSNKGSLADFLAQHKMSGETLEDAFTFSLVRDLHKGLADVHRTLTFHGRLSSTVCMVDNRMSLRVSDYGFSPYRMPPFYDPITVTNHENWLWCAPEVLRPVMEAIQKSTWAGTSGGLVGYPNLQPAEWARADMFSFGLICSEIFTIDKPYAEEPGEKEEVLNFLRRIAEQPSKATEIVKNTLTNKKVAADVSDMIVKCVSSEPLERSTIGDASALIRAMVKQRKLSANLTEMLMQQLESYAANLESIVEQRTEALAAEENKVRKLLHQILPPSVADALKNGEHVPPQQFESVTIYFSDVVGFTVISAQSTPLQIIDLLNDLYNAFDGILSTFDVYKVETIGDAYMVVSGLPKPNGKQHVRNIGLMSLGLIDHVKTKFKIRHRPDDQLRLRIGMHSGGCAAGVVGFVMPRYCLFGDTVNTASRMESTGEPLRIHVSESAANIIKELGLDEGPDAEFVLSDRGEIEVKGKGKMRTFWLTRPGDPIPPNVAELTHGH